MCWGTEACTARTDFVLGPVLQGLICCTGACTARTVCLVLGPVLQGLIFVYWGLYCKACFCVLGPVLQGLIFVLGPILQGLMHYCFTTDPVLTHIDTSTAPVLHPVLKTVLIHPLSIDILNFFFWHSFFVYALKANSVQFLDFCVLSLFFTLAWGRAMPPPIPPPP